MILALVENRRRTHNMLCLHGFNPRKTARLIILFILKNQFINNITFGTVKLYKNRLYCRKLLIGAPNSDCIKKAGA